MAPLDLAKTPQRYKERKTEMINGYEITTEPITQAYYAVEFDFDLKDKDGFLLQTTHTKVLPSFVSGTKNVFQAKIEQPIPYQAAIKVHDIVVHLSIVKCTHASPTSSPRHNRRARSFHKAILRHKAR
jgi:hypothetical protein